MTWERVLIRESVHPEEINQIAYENGWQFQELILPTETQPFEKIWVTADGEIQIHYIEDYLLGVRYLLVNGENRDTIISLIQTRIATFDRASIQLQLETATDANLAIRATYHLAVIAPEMFDPELFAYFKAMLLHPNNEVRRAAIFATAYAPWTEFRPYLERMKADDAAEDVREYAAFMLASHLRHTWCASE